MPGLRGPGLEIAPTCHTQVDAVSAAGARATVADDGVVPMRTPPRRRPVGAAVVQGAGVQICHGVMASERGLFAGQQTAC